LIVLSVSFLVVGKRSKTHPGGVSSELVNISQRDNLSGEATRVISGFQNSGWGYEVHINSFSHLVFFFFLCEGLSTSEKS
jgi:hypothetical protein